jgi:hypothetical protein
MLARIGVMKALDRHREHEPKPLAMMGLWVIIGGWSVSVFRRF